MFPSAYYAPRMFTEEYFSGSAATDTFQQITNLTTVQSLTIPNGVHFALCQAEAQNVRYRHDGGDPTTTVGMLLLTTNKPSLFSGKVLSRLRFIGAAGGAILNVTWK